MSPREHTQADDAVRGGRRASDVDLEPLSVGEPWPLPVPLDDYGSLPPFPVDSLPDVLRSWVIAASASTQTPPDLAAFCALGVIAACAQRIAVAEVRPAWTEPLGVYSYVALPSGSRKSSVFRFATSPLAAIEAAKAREMQRQINDAVTMRQVAEMRLKRAISAAAKSNGDPRAEADLRAATDALHAVVLPVPLRWMVDDATPEALTIRAAEQGGAIALMSAEADGFVTALGGRYGEEAHLGPLLAGHAGDPYRRDRVTGVPLVIPSLRLTVTLAAQQSALVALAPHAGRGLPARMLYAVPADGIGRRRDDGPPLPTSVSRRYAQLVEDLAELKPSEEPRTIRFSHGAREVIEAYHDILEPRLAGDLLCIQQTFPTLTQDHPDFRQSQLHPALRISRSSAAPAPARA